MLKTVYSALAVTALLAGTASFAADQTPAPATAAAPVAPVAAAATSATPAVATSAKEVVTPAKETVKATTKHVEHAVKTKASKEAAAPESSATSTPKK